MGPIPSPTRTGAAVEAASDWSNMRVVGPLDGAALGQSPGCSIPAPVLLAAEPIEAMMVSHYPVAPASSGPPTLQREPAH